MSLPLALAELQVVLRAGGGAAIWCAQALAQLGATVRAETVGQPGATAPSASATADSIVIESVEGTSEQQCAPRLLASSQAGVVVHIVEDHPALCARASPGLPRSGERSAQALVGTHAAVVALAALRWSRHHRRVVTVEVSTLEVLTTCLGHLLPGTLCAPTGGAGTTPSTDQHLDVLPCRDGFVGLAVRTDVERALLGRLVAGDRVDDADFDLPSTVRQWVAERTRAEVFHGAQLWRLPVAPCQDRTEAEHDPQSLSRRESPGGGQSPFRFSFRPDSAGGGPAEMRPDPLPLSDLRVLDLGMVWAGPYAGRLLAALGAHVTKVEGPQRRDGTRIAAWPSCAGTFADLNRGKRSLVLDLAREAGRNLFLRLVEQADVLLESFSPRVMINLGLTYPEVAERNPALLMLSMPAFGSTGPWADYVAYGGSLELATGLASYQGGRPQVARVPYLDYLAGTYGALAVLAALTTRDRDGTGAHVEVAQREVAFQLLRPSVRHLPLEPERWQAADCLVRDLRERGFLAERQTDEPCRGHLARAPWRMHPLGTQMEAPAPALGAHSAEILLHQAGLTPADLDAHVRAGVALVAERSAEACAA